MVEELIRETIGDYEYGQFNILDNDMCVRANPRERKLLLSPFYRHGQLPTQGSCAELMMTALKRLTTQLPDHYLARTIGNDPVYFPDVDGGDMHFFLLAFDEYVFSAEPHVDEADDIARMLETDPLLVDPSFGVVARFSESGYSVSKIFHPYCNMLCSNDILLEDQYGLPLGFNCANELVYLYALFDYSTTICVGFQKTGEEAQAYALDDPALDARVSDARDARIAQFVERLRELPIDMTDETLAVGDLFFV